MTENTENKSFGRRGGRTLLVKVLNGQFDVASLNFEGLTSHHFTEKSNIAFSLRYSLAARTSQFLS